MAERV
ncbi:hypothetical protein TIFTF001_056767 [Ficus carica]